MQVETGPVVLYVATKKGMWTLSSDRARQSFHLEGPAFLGHIIMERAFGFETEFAFRSPSDDRVLTATVCTGTGRIMVGPGMEAFGTRGTPDADAVTSMTYVYVDDVDAHYARARAAGAQIRAEPHAHFGGNRQYTASDPGGPRWTFAQPIEEPAGG